MSAAASSTTVPQDQDGVSAAKKSKPEELSAFKDQTKKTNDPTKIKVKY